MWTSGRHWTAEEAAASGIDAFYLQDLEMRVQQLTQLDYGDHCELMPVQCIGDQCMMLHEYMATLEDTEMRLNMALQQGYQPEYPPEYPQFQQGYAYPAHGGY